jgi:hypothetical protein
MGSSRALFHINVSRAALALCLGAPIAWPLMKSLLLSALLALALPAFGADSKDGYVSLFDGKTLDGWKFNDKPGTFKVENGELIVNGERSHLFYDGPVNNHVFKNFILRADIMAKKGSNSGVYIHTEFQPSGWPAKGYEVQVNNTHGDVKKGAGLYGIKDNMEAPAKDNEWYTMTIKVEGKHILISVNDKVITDYTEEQPPVRPAQFAGRFLSEGTFAIQGHDPKSEVHFKNIEVKVLP